MALNVLREKLDTLRVSQAHLASQMNVKPSFISMLMTGHKPFSLAMARRIWLTLPRSARTTDLAVELATAAVAGNSALRVCSIDIKRLLEYLDEGDADDDLKNIHEITIA